MLSEYRLTLLGALLVLILPYPALVALGHDPKDYAAFVGPALALLLAIYRGERNAKESAVRHEENQVTLSKLTGDNEAFRRALQALQEPETTVHDAARVAVEAMPPPSPSAESTTYIPPSPPMEPPKEDRPT